MLQIDKIYNGDCLEIMKQIEDKSIALVLTDPPYGFLNNIVCFSSGKGKCKAKPRQFQTNWDKPIGQDYFNDLFRISLNQIIFGFEYYAHYLPISRGIYCWDKKKPDSNNLDYGKFELIWTSFNQPTRFIRYTWNGMIREGNDDIKHPTQKPIKIIENLLINHSKENDIILDPFLGSGTTAVACINLNRHYIGIELSEEYCNKAEKRIAEAVKEKEQQPNLL